MDKAVTDRETVPIQSRCYLEVNKQNINYIKKRF